MGAAVFIKRVRGESAKKAFRDAVDDAIDESGSGGYSGTIAEKDSFVMVCCPDGVDPTDFANNLLEEDKHKVCDKHGPAGCIDCGNGQYLFFGFAAC